jgi:hypothetical protein
LKEFARGKYAIPALGKMLKDQSLLEEFLTSKRGPKLGDLDISKDLRIKLAGNPKLARSMAKKNNLLGPGRLTHANTDARSWAADALRRGRKGDQILTPENHIRITARSFSPTHGSATLKSPRTYIQWPPRNLESTDLAARLRGVKNFDDYRLYYFKRGLKEFGIVSVGTAKKALRGLRRGGKPTFLRPDGIPERSMYIPKGAPLEARAQIAAAFAEQGKNVSIEPHTVIVPRENAKIRAEEFAPDHGPRPFSDTIGVSLHEHGHAADHILTRASNAMNKRSERFRSALASGDMGAADKLGKQMGRVALRVERRANQNALKQIQAHGTDKETTAYKQWANKQMKQGYRNPIYQSAVAELGADTLSKKKAILREMPSLRSKFTNLAARLDALSLRLSSRLRGVKNFDDYRLYYFKGRNTGIAARSAEEARKKKKRGGDELVAVRTPNDTERSQMARGVWVRTRRDGKSPGQSRYGKGRGQGPARKSMGAKLSKIKFFAEKNEKRGLNPYAGAALSGAASGAALGGGLSLLTKGESLRTLAPWKNAGKAALHGGLLSAGIVGGGALLGSKIIGKPRKEESSPFLKRAAVGGALIGAGLGLGGGLLKNTAPVSKWLAKSAESGAFSRPASWLLKTNIPQAAAFGTVAGGLYGGVHAGEEGMQVDSIRNLRKDMKKFSVGSFQFSGKRLREFALIYKTGIGGAILSRSSKGSSFAETAKRAAKAVGGWAKRNGTAIGLTGAGVGASVAASRYYGPSNKGWKKLDEPKEFGRGDQARWDARRGGGVKSHEDSQFANTAWGWATDRPMYIPKRDSQGRMERDPDTGEAIRVKWDPSSGQLWNSIAREAKNKRVTVQRGGRLTRDAAAVLQGKERERDASGRIKKREWEKSWFHNKATEIGMTAAGLGGLATVRYANNNPDTKIGEAYKKTKASLRATKDGLSEIGGNILGGLTKITAKKAFSAKLKRLRELDAIAEYEGWDVRDPRGRSARVFAPGSRRRERRPKEWHEKTENERKLWKAGIAAGVLGGAGLTLVGQRLVSGKSLIPSRFMPKKVTPPDASVFIDAAKVFKAGA